MKLVEIGRGPDRAHHALVVEATEDEVRRLCALLFEEVQLRSAVEQQCAQTALCVGCGGRDPIVDEDGLCVVCGADVVVFADRHSLEMMMQSLGEAAGEGQDVATPCPGCTSCLPADELAGLEEQPYWRAPAVPCGGAR